MPKAPQSGLSDKTATSSFMKSLPIIE